MYTFRFDSAAKTGRAEEMLILKVQLIVCMSNSKERTRRICSQLGLMFIIIGITMTVFGSIITVLFNVGQIGDGLWVSGMYYALSGLVYHPSTWESLPIPFYPQRTPMMGILLTLAATGTLWHATLLPLLFG